LRVWWVGPPNGWNQQNESLVKHKSADILCRAA